MFFEYVLLILMAGWTLGSLAFSWPPLRLPKVLGRRNKFLALASWNVFGTYGGQSRICVYAFEYRDRTEGQPGPGPWLEAMRGRPWCWHAFLWQPGRRVADRFHRLGQEIARHLEQGIPADQWLGKRQAVVVDFLSRKLPLARGSIREVRVRMICSVVDEQISSSDKSKRQVRIESHVLVTFPASQSTYAD